MVQSPQTASTISGMRGTMGNVPGTLECWLLLRSLRTLSLRVMRQSASAAALAQWLSKHPAIAKTCASVIGLLSVFVCVRVFVWMIV